MFAHSKEGVVRKCVLLEESELEPVTDGLDLADLLRKKLHIPNHVYVALKLPLALPRELKLAFTAPSDSRHLKLEIAFLDKKSALVSALDELRRTVERENFGAYAIQVEAVLGKFVAMFSRVYDMWMQCPQKKI